MLPNQIGNKIIQTLTCLVVMSVMAQAQWPEHFYFRLNEGAGTATEDLAYPGLGTAPVQNSGWALPGVLGAACLDGSASTGALETNAPFALSGNWTLEYWAYDAEASTTLNYSFGENGGAAFRAFSGGVAPAGGIVLRGTGVTDTPIAGAAVLNSWQHVAWVYNDAALTITPYLNGVAQAPVAQAANIVFAGTDAIGLVVGGRSATSQPYNGRIDEFRFWSQLRSTGQISGNMNNELVVSNFPYRQDFEAFGIPGSGNNNRTLGNWHQSVANSGARPDWYFGTGTTSSAGPETNGLGDRSSGAGRFGFIEDSSNDSSQIDVFTPYFDLRGTTSPSARIFVHAHDFFSGDPAQFNPFAMVAVDASGNETTLAKVTADTGDVWVEVFGDLSAFVGQSVRLAMRSTNSASLFYCDTSIDEFAICDSDEIGGQAPMPGIAAFDVNGSAENCFGDGVSDYVAGGGPYREAISNGGVVSFDFFGEANQGVLMLLGPLNIHVTDYPGFGQFDIGAFPLVGGVPSNLVVQGDGISTPLIGLNNFFRTNASGVGNFAMIIPTLPLGSFGNFQCIMQNSVQIIGFANAVAVDVQ